MIAGVRGGSMNKLFAQTRRRAKPALLTTRSDEDGADAAPRPTRRHGRLVINSQPGANHGGQVAASLIPLRQFAEAALRQI